MKVVCSWCRREGKTALMGEKAPLKDTRETHGICTVHRHEVETRWQTSIHDASSTRIETGLSSELFRWASSLHVTVKMRH